MLKIKEIREDKGLTVEKLASDMGISVRTIYRWEAGTTDITGNNLIALADYFGCTTDELLGRENCEDVIIKSEIEKRKELRPSTLQLVKASEPLNDMGIAVVIGYIARLIEENPEFVKIRRQS